MYISRRTHPLTWLPEARRLKTVGVHVPESSKEYMRRKHETDSLIRHMKMKTIRQRNFRLFRSLRTLQGLDYLHALRGVERVEFWDYDVYLKDGTKQVVRDFTFVMDLNNAVQRPKHARDLQMAQLRNLAPLLPTYEPSDGEWIAIEAIIDRVVIEPDRPALIPGPQAPIGPAAIVIDSDPEEDSESKSSDSSESSDSGDDGSSDDDGSGGGDNNGGSEIREDKDDGDNDDGGNGGANIDSAVAAMAYLATEMNLEAADEVAESENMDDEDTENEDRGDEGANMDINLDFDDVNMHLDGDLGRYSDNRDTPIDLTSDDDDDDGDRDAYPSSSESVAYSPRAEMHQTPPSEGRLGIIQEEESLFVSPNYTARPLDVRVADLPERETPAFRTSPEERESPLFLPSPENVERPVFQMKVESRSPSGRAQTRESREETQESGPLFVTPTPYAQLVQRSPTVRSLTIDLTGDDPHEDSREASEKASLGAASLGEARQSRKRSGDSESSAESYPKRTRMDLT
ncbi:Fc.00g040180.m01.CDS01 [Cosmosporella sp. VM-42]